MLTLMKEGQQGWAQSKAHTWCHSEHPLLKALLHALESLQ